MITGISYVIHQYGLIGADGTGPDSGPATDGRIDAESLLSCRQRQVAMRPSVSVPSMCPNIIHRNAGTMLLMSCLRRCD